MTTPYLVFGDFRPDTLAEACSGYPLTASDAPDAAITASIARLSQRVDDFTHDHFDAVTKTVIYDGSGTSTLFLKERATAISAVNIIDRVGTLYLVNAQSYRLRSSLEQAGSVRRSAHDDDLDWLGIPPLGYPLPSVAPMFTDPWTWPYGDQNVSVAGTFGWTTCPADIKRAVALLVYDALKPSRADLLRADRYSTAETTMTISNPFPNPGQQVYTGVPEVDDIIADYQRAMPSLGVA